MVGTILILMSLFMTGMTSHAANPPCVQVYRAAYFEFAKSTAPNAQLIEANEIYKIYFDFSNGISDAFVEAAPLFQALAIKPGFEHDTLLLLKLKIERGDLCKGSSPMRYSEAVEALR